MTTKMTRREFMGEFERERCRCHGAAGDRRRGWRPSRASGPRCRGAGAAPRTRRDRAWRPPGPAPRPPRSRPSGRVPTSARGPRPGADGTRHPERVRRHLLGPAEMRFRLIEDHREVFPVRAMCSVPGVDVSGCYARRDRPESARAGTNRAPVEDFRRVHADSRRRHGGPRVHASPRAEGKRVGLEPGGRPITASRDDPRSIRRPRTPKQR